LDTLVARILISENFFENVDFFHTWQNNSLGKPSQAELFAFKTQPNQAFFFPKLSYF